MNGYDAWQAIEQVTDAEEALALAAGRLHRAQLEAVLGIRYDDVKYDRAVLEYRRAARELARAADEGRQRQWWPPQPTPRAVQPAA